MKIGAIANSYYYKGQVNKSASFKGSESPGGSSSSESPGGSSSPRKPSKLESKHKSLQQKVADLEARIRVRNAQAASNAKIEKDNADLEERIRQLQAELDENK